MRFYTNVSKRGNAIYERYIENGERKMDKVYFKPELFIRSNKVEDTQAKSEIGENLSRIEFGNLDDLNEFVDKYKEYEGFSMYGMKDHILQYITRNYPGEIKFDESKIHCGYIDIEVFSGSVINGVVVPGPFPEPDQAKYPITMITVYHSVHKKYYTWGLEEYMGVTLSHNVDLPDLIYKGYTKESELLTDFTLWWFNQKFDCYTGFNSETFDTPYIINRIKNILDASYVNRFSPWGIVTAKTFQTSWGEQSTYVFLGCPCIDYKDLVQKHGYVTLPEWNLNEVASHFLGMEKIDYSEIGDINKLYILNYHKYLEYNIHDVRILVEMEKKVKYMFLTYTAAYETHCNYEDTLGTVRPWSALCYNRLYNKGIQPLLKRVYQGNIEFPGGFVLDVTPGRYKWVLSVDAKSLYPHMTMQFNLSPANKIVGEARQIIINELIQELTTEMSYSLGSRYDWLNKLRIAISNGSYVHEFLWEDVHEFKTLKKYNVCMAPNITFYKNDPISLFHEIYDDVYYNKRLIAQSEMEKKEIQLNELKKQDNYDKQLADQLTNEIAALNSKQLAYKIAIMNAGYGAMSNRYFTEFFDLEVASAITTAGQTSVRYISRKLNEYFNSVCKTSNKQYVIANDTDSCYVCLDDLVSRVCQNKSDTEIVEFLDQLFKRKIEPLMLQWAEELSNSLNCSKNRLIFAREVIAKEGIWTAKKHYALAVYDNKGKRYNEPRLKVVGLESVRSTYPKHCRKWLEECYMICLLKTERDIHKKVAEIETQFKQKPINEIATVSSVNGMEKYTENGLAIKGTPKHVKAAINHNNLVKQLKLNVPLIQSGSKLMYVGLVTPNPYKMDVIAFQTTPPVEFNLEKYTNKKDNFEKNFISPLQLFLNVINWNHKPVANLSDLF